MKRKNNEKKLKTVLITGASQGIGAALLNQYSQKGHRVVVLARTNPDNHADFIVCDLTDTDQLLRAAETIAKRYKTLDLVVHNAGVGISGATELLEESDVRRVMELNYTAVLLLTQKLLPILARDGKIVIISSACALFALPFRGVYCASKAAVSMLAYGLRMELSHTGIQVVCVCPGDVKSTFTKNRLKDNKTNERYLTRVENARKKVDDRQDKRMPLQSVGKKIFNICEKKNKALYIIGFKYKMLNFFNRILPVNLFLKLTDKLFGGK